MAVFEIPTEQGTYRVTAASEDEARARYAQGEGDLVPAAALPQPTPPESPGIMGRVMQGARDASNLFSTGGAVQPWMSAPVKDTVQEAITAPSNVGEMIGTSLPVGPFRPVTGAVGAGLGEGVRQWWAGEPLDVKKMGTEAGLSLLPEVAESGGRAIIKQFARNTPGGQILRFEQAAKESRQLPEKVFQPRPADEISDAFDDVRRSGLNIDTQDINRHLSTLSPGKQADVENVLVQLDREHKTGGRYTQLYQALMTGQSMAGSSIGDLQTLRSHLRQRAEIMDPGEGRQLVRDFQASVDDAIDFGMTSGAMQASTPQIRQTLHQARQDWARRAAADDLADMIENKITSTGDLKSEVIQIRAMYDELRRGRSQASKSLNRALDLTPGARDTFEKEVHDIARLYETIQISMTDVGGISRMPVIAAIRQGIGQALLTDQGRKWLRDAVVEGRGALSPNAVATLTSAYRREGAPGIVKPASVRSWWAPGALTR